ncbi:SgrR family transcriptional regulator [Vibrio barjaei]|uniref:SgrR family transcriptional regulator n=1 Tax=Vibrio barjaei TaxID=1676683 RepID=UPI002283CBD6|nr:SgrR family transcriptional regulator [Vibrio barjaei]MCY9870994.1 SgrR family transcriptional regulator [Vibrio barjaei]
MGSSPFYSITQLRRLQQLNQLYSVGTTQSVTVGELAENLSCSERNVSKLMGTLMDRGWLDWKAGRGRGNLSQVTLLVDFKAVTLLQLRALVGVGQVQTAFEIAEHFDFQIDFKANLSNWLQDAESELRKQNTLIYATPFPLPEWRPMHARSSRSIMLLEGVFDTLLRFDTVTQRVIPHLAHHFSYQDNQLSFRLRSDVYFHDNHRLTAEKVKDNLLIRHNSEHSYKILFRHLESVTIEGQWVHIKLRQHDPVFVHLLADVHSGIFDTEQPTFPNGTGPYSVGMFKSFHWSLTKNHRYFALGGLIDQVEFWETDSSPKAAHFEELRDLSSNNDEDSQVAEQDGGLVLQFIHHNNMLSPEERHWIVNQFRAVEMNMCQANSIMRCHQNEGLYFFTTTSALPRRPVVIEVRHVHRNLLLKVLEQIDVASESWVVVDKGDAHDYSVDIYFDCYVFSEDQAFQYYEWLLTSDVFLRCLSVENQKNMTRFLDEWLEESQTSDDFLLKMHKAENWLIQQFYYCPLWRDDMIFKTSHNLSGVEINAMGVPTLAKMWLD